MTAPTNPEARARLDALGTVLRGHGFRAQTRPDGLHVANPTVTGCCVPHPSTVVTVAKRDGVRWFFTAGNCPLVEAGRVTDAVTALAGLLDGKAGVRL